MTANLRPRMTMKQKTRSPPSRTGGTTDSQIKARTRTKAHHSAAIGTLPEQETIGTETGNTVSTAKSRIILKKSAEKESEKNNHAKTNKDVPNGQKCM